MLVLSWPKFDRVVHWPKVGQKELVKLIDETVNELAAVLVAHSIDVRLCSIVTHFENAHFSGVIVDWQLQVIS
jgi:hypothetical protein